MVRSAPGGAPPRGDTHGRPAARARPRPARHRAAERAGIGASAVRPGAHPAAGLRRPAAAVQRRLPGRREHPGLAGAWPRPAARGGVAAADRATTRSPRSTAGSATTRARTSATGRSSTARSRSTRSSGSSATSRIEQRLGASTRRRQRTGKRVLVVGSGPSGLSAAYHLARLGHEVEIRDSGPLAGRDDALRHPDLPAAAATCWTPRSAGIAAPGRQLRAGPPGRGPAGRDDARAASTRRSSRSAPTCPSGSTSPTRTPAAVVDAVAFLRGVASGRAAGARPAGSRSTAAATPRWTPPGSPAGSAPTTPSSSTAAPASRCPPTRTRPQDAEAEGVRINWLRTISLDGRARAHRRDPGARRARPARTAPGVFETLEADTVILALGQESDTGFLHERARRRVRRRRGPGRRAPTLMTGAPGVFAGGDAVPSERTVTVGVGHGKKAARNIDAWLRGAGAHQRAQAPGGRASTSSPVVLRRPQPAPAGRPRPGRPGCRRSTRCVAGLTADEARYEAGRCLSCGNCFECDGCLGACPEDAVIKLGVGPPLPVRLRHVHRLRHAAPSSARCTPSR